MQVICTDGTVLQCDRFEAIDSGVLLFDADPEDEDADEERDDEATAFVPLHQLRFVVPDGFRPGGASGRASGQTAPQSRAQGPPPGGRPPQGQAPPRGTQRGQPPSQQGAPGQGPGRRQGGR